MAHIENDKDDADENENEDERTEKKILDKKKQVDSFFIEVDDQNENDGNVEI